MDIALEKKAKEKGLTIVGLEGIFDAFVSEKSNLKKEADELISDLREDDEISPLSFVNTLSDVYRTQNMKSLIDFEVKVDSIFRTSPKLTEIGKRIREDLLKRRNLNWMNKIPELMKAQPTFIAVGVRRENMVFCDSRGVVSAHREDLNPLKREFATPRRISTLAEALHDADVFLGVSKADTLTPEMLRTMASNPIVMALANPDPEIAYDTAVVSRPDIIFATGRSDYPNQVNNVLGFPYIFRGALDVRASKINEEMKLAAAHAIAALAREPIPASVLRAYNLEKLEFGRSYLIPKPLDPRLLCTVATAVARAAVESGVARRPVADWDAYAERLRTLAE